MVLVAVTPTRMYAPESAAVVVYVEAVLPLITVQPVPLAPVQRSQRYVYEVDR